MLLSRRIVSSIFVFTMAVAPSAALAKDDHATPGHDWGYVGDHGPQHWGALKADYAACASGKQQAPIDIRGAVPSDLDPIQFAYKPSPLSIVDNGHSIQINYARGARSPSAVNDTS